MRWPAFVGVVVAIVGSVVLTTTAWAAPAPTSLGPVVVPNVPLQVCVGARCTPTPPVSFVSMDLSTDVQSGSVGAAGTVSQTACAPTSTGLAAQIASGTGSTTVTGRLTLGIAGGGSVVLPIRQSLAAGAPALVISACSGS